MKYILIIIWVHFMDGPRFVHIEGEEWPTYAQCMVAGGQVVPPTDPGIAWYTITCETVTPLPVAVATKKEPVM